MRVERVSDPAIHPSGDYFAYVVTKHDPDENTITSTIRVLDMESGDNRVVTPGSGSHSCPAWSSDGRYLAFVSDREGEKQVWVLPFLEGGEARCVTSGYGEADRPLWSPEGDRIAFSRRVPVTPFWDGTLEDVENGEKRKQLVHSKSYGLVNPSSTARIEDSLLYRHWDRWRGKERNHLFIVDLLTGKIEDVTPWDSDAPPISLGGSRDYDFSPEGDEIAYVRNPDEKVEISVNNSIWIQKLDGIKRVGEPRNISTNNAMDCDPRYSPDGSYIAYCGGDRPGYEADRLQVRVFDRETGETRSLTEKFDRSANMIVWNSSSDDIFFVSPDNGYCSIYGVDILSGRVRQLTHGTYNGSIYMMPDARLLVVRESATSPADLYIVSVEKGCEPILEKGVEDLKEQKAERVTIHSKWFEEELDIHPLEEFWYPGDGGDMVHGFQLKPPGFDQGKKHPCILLIHGGPQSAFYNSFKYRWNPQLFASRGYVVLMLNPRGSTGYGQEFTDQISGDWGGKCYRDIMLGLEYCLKEFPYIDSDRMAAAGASFGGFMINWIEGHDNPFKALVSHDGIFNAENMAYMTDELWFDRWEHGGMPHENREGYRKYSPHMNVEKFRTPCLVIQGELDFRCTVSEGLAMFTALQTMDVPSKLLYFPDEGHWVLKPANAEVWYDTVQGFIDEYVGY